MCWSTPQARCGAGPGERRDDFAEVGWASLMQRLRNCVILMPLSAEGLPSTPGLQSQALRLMTSYWVLLGPLEWNPGCVVTPGRIPGPAGGPVYAGHGWRPAPVNWRWRGPMAARLLLIRRGRGERSSGGDRGAMRQLAALLANAEPPSRTDSPVAASDCPRLYLSPTGRYQWPPTAPVSSRCGFWGRLAL